MRTPKINWRTIWFDFKLYFFKHCMLKLYWFIIIVTGCAAIMNFSMMMYYYYKINEIKNESEVVFKELCTMQKRALETTQVAKETIAEADSLRNIYLDLIESVKTSDD